MNVSRTLVRAVAAAALLAASCSDSGGGGSAEAPLSAPTGLAAGTVRGAFDLVELTWSAPRTTDDLEFQVRVPGGEWTTQPYRIPSSSALLLLALPPDAPEATTYGFRARALRGDAASAWSAEAAFFRGVRPAGDLAIGGVSDPYLGPVLSLTWTRRSQVADRVRLERQIRPDSGTAGPWVELSLPADATTYQDVNPPGWVDFARCAYRITYWAGDVGSEPVEVESDPGGLAAPRDLAATVTGTDVHLSWTNVSTAATRIDVSRWKQGVWDSRTWTLAPDATSVDDTGLTPGVYRYVVQAVSSAGSGYLSSPSQAAAVVPAATHATTFPARVVTLPIGSAVARRADGAFAVGQGTQNTSTYPSFVFAPTDAAWDRFETPTAATLGLPGPLLDAAGDVHALYAEEVWNGATLAPVRHVWRDGAGWHVELVGLGPSRPSAAIAPDGSIRAVWPLKDGKGFAYATNASGTFVVEEVRPVAGTAVRMQAPLALEAGAPRVLVVETYGSPARAWLVSRDAGAWSAEELAAPPPADAGWHLLPGGGTLAWIYARWTGYGYAAYLRERTGGVWGAEELLVASTTTTPLPGIGAARSPDGTRIALALPGRDHPSPADVARVAVREGGVTTVTDLLPSAAGAQVGFTSEGKVWVLDGLEVWPGGSGTVGPCVLYEEP